MEPHKHNHFEIMCVTAGVVQLPIYRYCQDCDILQEAKLLTLKRGDVIYISPGVIHGFRNADQNRSCQVINVEFQFQEDSGELFQFHGDKILELSQAMRTWAENYKPYAVIHDESGNLHQILSMLVDRISQLEDSPGRGQDLQTVSLFWSMLLMLSECIAKNQEQRQQTTYVQAITNFLADNYSAEVSIESVADHFHLNPSYMQRLFKKSTGMSIITYLNDLRIKKAAALMLSGMPLIDIAMSCGINSRQYFWKLFQKYYGCSPNEYRQTHYLGLDGEGEADRLARELHSAATVPFYDL